MRKNMKKLTVATVIGAMTVTALAPVGAQAKDKTLTVAIWDNGQKAGLQETAKCIRRDAGSHVCGTVCLKQWISSH